MIFDENKFLMKISNYRKSIYKNNSSPSNKDSYEKKKSNEEKK